METKKVQISDIPDLAAEAAKSESNKAQTKLLMVQVQSAGYNSGNFAIIVVDNNPIEVGKNISGHCRGLHLAILNPFTGKPQF